MPECSLVFLNGPALRPADSSASCHAERGGRVECWGHSVEAFSNSLPFQPGKKVWIADGGFAHFAAYFENALEWQNALANGTLSEVFWTGDADSLSPEHLQWLITAQQKFPESIHLQNLLPQKNISDGAALLDSLLKNFKGSAEFQKTPLILEIEGGLGGRRDHEWANIWEAVELAKSIPAGAMFVLKSRAEGCIVATLPVALELKSGSNFSVFSTYQNQSISISGALYSGSFVLERSSHGLSNACVAPQVLISSSIAHSVEKSVVVLFY